MSEQYKIVGDLTDTRASEFEEIWLLRDKLIRLLASDRIVNKRKIYNSRAVLGEDI